jgi:hypothetical protein
MTLTPSRQPSSCSARSAKEVHLECLQDGLEERMAQ